jgi:hypothetical protein
MLQRFDNDGDATTLLFPGERTLTRSMLLIVGEDEVDSERGT